MDSTNTIDPSWNRQSLTLRLSKERRAGLLALVAGLAPQLAPTAAIDHAIALAIAGKAAREFSDHDALAEAMSLLAADFKREASKQTSAIEEIARCVKSLRDLIAAAADPDETQSADGPLPIRAWLDREAKRLPKPSFLARAQWQGKGRLDERHVWVDLLVDRVATADVHGEATRGIGALARLGPVEIEGPFGRLDTVPWVYIMCTGSRRGGWKLDLHKIQSNGEPAASSACLSV